MSKAEKSTEKKELVLNKNTGFLNLSTKKTHKDSPDFFGSVNIDGIVYKMGGWNKESKEGGKKYISVNLDKADLTKDEKIALRKGYLADHLEKKELEENKGSFILLQNTGTIHVSKKEDKEDMFGTFNVEGQTVSVKLFAFEKEGVPIMRVTVSDGLMSKEDRAEITNGFIN